MPLQHEELTHKIIGASITVHKKLGPGFVESIYQRSLCKELKKVGVGFDVEVHAPVHYDDEEVGHHKIDLLAEGLIVVELKAVKHLEDGHFSVVRSYLRALDLEHGLLLNFAKPTLEIRRVIISVRP